MNSHPNWSELWLSVGSVVVSLLLGEIAARKFLPPPFRVFQPPTAKGKANGAAMRSLHRPDPKIGWVLSDDPVEYRHRLTNKDGAVEYDVVYSVAHGQRRTSAQPPDGPILVVTGASVTFGHGLNDQDTWPWMLQDRLPEYRVSNVATMAYGTDQALLAAERQVMSSPRPKAVLLGFDDFQIDRNRAAQGWVAFVYPFSKPLFAIGPGGVEYRRQVRIWSPPVLSYSDLFAHATNILANRFYGVPNHAQALKLTAALVSAFALRFQALGVRLAVVVLPNAEDQSPQSRADQTFLIESLNQERIPALIPDFPRLPGGKFDARRFMVSPTDSHPNREYNRILVEQLQPFLRSNGIADD